MPQVRRTKIVATLGPATDEPAVLRAILEAGVDVVRLNMSHGSQEDHARRYRLVRELEAEIGRPVGILVDLQGPKIRIGRFAAGPIRLDPGQPFRLDLDPAPGDTSRVQLPHPEVFAAAVPGSELLLDDGRIRLRIERVQEGVLETVVEVGGALADHKGVNVPGVVLPIPALSEKDMRDLAFALDLGVDWIALSFVQRPDDVAQLRKLVMGRAGVLAKIEKPAAVEHLGEIVDLADAVMIARGDLGVELPPEKVPGLQKRIIRCARDAGKPVVVATQMLESMRDAPIPTRAEASDVANAVYDGADAVMLSAETASGHYPLEAVRMMRRIIYEVERDELYRAYLDAYRARAEPQPADAITMAAREVARVMKAACIVCYTTSGATALRAARERPEHPVLGLVTRLPTARRLTLVWGVHSVVTEDARDVDDMVEKARYWARTTGVAEPGSAIVVTAGVPFGTPGATNLLRLAWVT